MRALIGMNVTLESAGTQGDNAPRYPTGGQIAEALTAVGLQPPGLVGKPEPETPTVPESALFSKLAEITTAVIEEQTPAEDDLLRQSTVSRGGEQPPTFADLARKHLDVTDVDGPSVVSLASYALPVLMRMPARNAEDRERRKLAAEALVYASVVTPTRSQFVVSSENQSSITIRLHHQLIERLQQGCEDLLSLLATPIEIGAGTVRFAIEGRIEIYEVGQEDSTISGQLVGFTMRDRWRYLVKTESVGVLVAFSLLVAFSALFLFLFLHHMNNPSATVSVVGTPGQLHFSQADQFWLGQAERLQSGVVPVLLVTLITLLVKYPRRQVVTWTQLLRPEGRPRGSR